MYAYQDQYDIYVDIEPFIAKDNIRMMNQKRTHYVNSIVYQQYY